MDERPGDPSETRASFDAAVHIRGQKIWISASALLVLVGVTSSLLAAGAVRRDDAARAWQTFTASSDEVASTLQLAILHEQDLIVDASGFIAGNPRASNLQFGRWADSVDALARYPELLGLGHAIVVSAAALPAFAARAVIDPTGPLAANGAFQVVPPGRRSYYCLVVAGQSRGRPGSFPAGEDLCPPGPSRTALMSARDSSKGAYLPLKIGSATFLSIMTPVYRGGVAPTRSPKRSSGRSFNSARTSD